MPLKLLHFGRAMDKSGLKFVIDSEAEKTL